MKLMQVEVQHFGCLRRAKLDLGPGLNVLYGPNDLGKSTLTHAIRAALLLPHTSAVAKKFTPWDSDEDPLVKLTFSLPDGRYWQVEKRFGRSSLLRESNDGRTFNAPFKKGREVDAELREKLAWGVASPATKGIQRGLPTTFLSTVLLGEQANVTEVLRSTLEADTDESGRERLTAALSAFAQDPTFKNMLESAQSKVDEAFTTHTGRRKRGAKSPFVTASEHVKHAKASLELLQKRAAESESAIQELAEKNETQDIHEEALARCSRELEAVESALAQQEKRHAIESVVTEAAETLRIAQEKQEAFQKREADLRDVRAEAQTLEEKKDAALAQQQEAQQQLRVAEDSLVRSQNQEAEQARQLRRGQLEKQQLELESSAKSLADEREKMNRARTLHDQMQQHEVALERLTEQETAANETSEKSQLVMIRAESALGDLDLARRVRRVREVEVELAALQKSKETADKHMAAARVASDAEAEAQKKLRHDLPSEAAVAGMRELLGERDLSEARLGGGMAVSVELLKAVGVQGTRDGVPLELVGDGAMHFDADRAFTLQLGDIARIDVKAGSPEARQAVHDLQARIELEVEPTLKRLGVDDMAALTTMIEADNSARRECEKLASKAQSLTDIAAAQRTDLARLSELPAILAELRRDLKDTPTEAAEALLDQLGDDSLEGREAALRTQVAEARADFDEAKNLVQSVATERKLLQQQTDATKQNLDELGLAEPAGGWESAAAELAGRSENLTAQKRAIELQLTELMSEQAAEVTLLEAARLEAKSSLEQASQGLEEATRRASEIAKKAASLEGEIKISRPSVEALDIAALQSGVNEAQTKLDELRPALKPVSEEDRQQSVIKRDAAKREYEQARDDVRKAEGRLQTVSGQVVVEETERAQEALALAEQMEREIEVDYDGWQLLLKKLRDAENTEGQHLGQALSQPVSERFAELTGGRYSRLEVQPGLNADGVRVGGMLRGVESLSVGTQEQLATLLRLTIAEHLGTMLILDDHLTQTDPDRIEWFRRLLRVHASEAQLIIMTCHPLDYLDGPEMPSPGESIARSASGLIHALDLTEMVERSSPSAVPTQEGS